MENQKEINGAYDYRHRTLSSGDWAINIVLAGIPVIGWILLLVWALGDGNIHRKNWARGMFLIWILVIAFTVFAVVFFGFAGVLLNEQNKFIE